jgi:hypothetical protein
MIEERTELKVPEDAPGVMVPMYFPGDRMVVRRSVTPEPGDVAVGIPLREGVFEFFAVSGVYCGGHGTCARDECVGMPEGCLVPVNRNFEPFPRRDVQIIGLVEGKA